MTSADRITVAVVDFHATWGDIAGNLARIVERTHRAADAGAHLVLFPETALSGYNTPGRCADMQRGAAVSVTGPEAAEVIALARTLDIHLVVGLPERDDATGAIYNSALVAGPDGPIGCYRKLHPAADESLWAAKGDEPLLFDTRWGPIGVSICYDTYHFPELIRAYSAMGARLCLNPTAVPDVPHWRGYYHTQLKARVVENGCFIASANLVGEDAAMRFPGASLVIGPCDGSAIATELYAEPVEDEEGLRIATLDLSAVDRARARLPVFTANRVTGVPDWRPDLCDRLLTRVRERESVRQG